MKPYSCVYENQDGSCAIRQKHDLSVECTLNTCIAYTDKEMVARYFRCTICPQCSKYAQCWRYESYNGPGPCQGISETLTGRICHNICGKAPDPYIVDQRWGNGI